MNAIMCDRFRGSRVSLETNANRAGEELSALLLECVRACVRVQEQWKRRPGAFLQDYVLRRRRPGDRRLFHYIVERRNGKPSKVTVSFMTDSTVSGVPLAPFAPVD